MQKLNFIYIYQLKDQKKFKLVLFGPPQIEELTIIDEFKFSHYTECFSVKDIKTKLATAVDAIYLIEFNKAQISKRSYTTKQL